MKRMTDIHDFNVGEYYIHRRENKDVLFIVRNIAKEMSQTSFAEFVVRGVTVNNIDGSKSAITIYEETVYTYVIFHITKEEYPEYFL